MYAAVVDTYQQLLKNAPPSGRANVELETESLAQAQGELQHFERLLESGGHDRAYEFLQRGLTQLATVRHESWKSATSAFSSPVASPLCVSFFSLPQHYLLGRRLRGAAWGPNSLAGGNFESLEHLQTSGWKNITSNQPQLGTGVELSLYAPQSGRSALRLQCWPVEPSQAPAVIESPPISIISGPVPVRGGQVVRIHGWARVPETIHGSFDGLLIYDSLAGRELAERITLAENWREFTLYRAAPRQGDLTITLALSGIGQAWVDDLTVNLLDLPTAQAQTPTPINRGHAVTQPLTTWRSTCGCQGMHDRFNISPGKHRRFDLDQIEHAMDYSGANLIWMAAVGTAVVTLIVVTLFVLLRRRRKEPVEATPEIAVDLSQLDSSGPIKEGPRLEFYGLPVRMAVIVVAPAGRNSELPPAEVLPGLMERLVPGLSQVIANHKPMILRWPAQLSSHGFAQAFFSKVAMPGTRGKGTPWCSIAGKHPIGVQAFQVGIAFCSGSPNSLSQVIIQHEGQWLDILRIRDE